MSEKPVILINLTRSGDAQAFDEQEIIQRDAKDSFFRHVEQSLGKIDPFLQKLDKNNLLDPIHHHDTILISGPRGSGKTSFLLSMLEIIKNNNKLNTRIDLLKILDPTLQASEGHAFLHIITLIRQRVLDHRKAPELRDKCLTDHDSRGSDSWCSKDGAYQDWLNALNKLAKGLGILDGSGLNDFKAQNWTDPHRVMETESNHVQAGIELAFRFHCFVNLSLKLLKKEAFLLMFDDIDTHCKSGWPLLEVIRKYLTTPQIIAVLSGDINLYSIMVRQNQYLNFNSGLIRFDNNDKKYLEVLNNLEKEYLLKVLKTERRIELITLDETLYKYDLCYDGKGSIEQFVSDIFQQAFSINNSNDKLALQRYFFRESIRFNQNFLRAALQNRGESSGYSDAFYGHLVDMFFVPLDQGGFRPNELKHPNPANILDNLLLSLVNNNLLERGFRLRPEFNDRQIDGQMIAMGALVTHVARKNPDLYFKYFIKIALTQTVWQIAQYSASPITLYNYIDFLGIKYNNYSIDIARKATACMHALLSSADKSSRFRQFLNKGIVTLRALNQGDKRVRLSWQDGDFRQIAILYQIPNSLIVQNRDTSWLSEWIRTQAPDSYAKRFHGLIDVKHPLTNMKAGYFNRLGDLYNGISSWHRYAVYLPLTLTRNKNGNKIPIYSIFPMLAALGELIYYAKGDNNERFTLLTTVKWLSSIIYTTPWFKMLDSDDTSPTTTEELEPEDFEQPEASDEESGDADFFNAIENWIKAAPKQGISMVVLARAWTRFTQTLDSQDNLFKIHHIYLGHLLHRQIIALLNAILIEESWSVERAEVFRNATLSDKIFYKNIRLVAQTPNASDSFDIMQDKTPFFHWVASCPVWGLYVENDPQPGSLFQFILRANSLHPNALKPTYHGQDCFDNLFDPLNSVLIAVDRRFMDLRTMPLPGEEPAEAESAPEEQPPPAGMGPEAPRTGKRNASLALSARDREFLDLMTENKLFRRLKSERLQYEDVERIAEEIAAEFLLKMRHYRLAQKGNPVLQVAKEYIVNLIYPKG
ncbi:MAG: hypothetical protein HQM03_00445 [Magnetococcales bacterium]|nr:hypothetical protein [Magnetococcales bacterium]